MVCFWCLLFLLRERINPRLLCVHKGYHLCKESQTISHLFWLTQLLEILSVKLCFLNLYKWIIYISHVLNKLQSKCDILCIYNYIKPSIYKILLTLNSPSVIINETKFWFLIFFLFLHLVEFCWCFCFLGFFFFIISSCCLLICYWDIFALKTKVDFFQNFHYILVLKKYSKELTFYPCLFFVVVFFFLLFFFYTLTHYLFIFLVFFFYCYI